MPALIDKLSRWQRYASGSGVPLSLVLFNVGVIVALWVAVLRQIEAERLEAIRAAIERNDSFAVAFEHFTIRTIESADAALRRMVRAAERPEGSIDLEESATDLLRDNRVMAGIVVTDPRGAVIAAVSPSGEIGRIGLGEQDFFKAQSDRDTGRLVVGTPATGIIPGVATVPLTRRIKRPDGSFGGMVAILIEPRRFTEVLQDTSMRALDIISLIGLDGITRARLSGTVPSHGQDIRGSPLFAEQSRRPNGNYFAPGRLDGVPRFFSYRTLSDYDLMTTVGRTEADVLAPIKVRRARYLWVSAFASVVIAGFTVALAGALAEQRRATDRLARSRARFREAFSQAPIGIAHFSLDGRCLNVNRALGEILGYPTEELLKRTIGDIAPDEWRPPEGGLASRRALPAGLMNARGERVCVRKDGGEVWCDVAISVVRDASGQPEQFAAVIRDVSDRKRAEQAARTEQLFANAMIDSLPGILYFYDRHGRFLRWNRRFVEVSGYSAEEIGRMHPLDFFRGEDKRLVGGKIDEVFERGEAFCEASFVAKDGTAIPYFMTGRRVDFEGRPCLIGVGIDVTERRLVEEERHRLARQVAWERARLIEAQAVAKIGSWETSVADFKVTWSQETFRIFELDPAHFVPTHAAFLARVHPEDRERVDAAFVASLGESAPGSIEHRIVMADGRVKTVEERWQVYFDEQGAAARVSGTCQDITQRKAFERSLQEYADRLQVVSRRLLEVQEDERRLLARELHDTVGQELTALSLNLSIIGANLPENVTAAVGERMADSQRLVEETTLHLRHVMTELRPPGIDELGLLAALKEHAHRVARRGELTLTFEGEEPRPRLPPAMSVALFRIAQEALNNIVKHARANAVAIVLRRDARRIALTITDDGIGLGTVRKPRDGRTGMGMTTMRERAEAIGGLWRVESGPVRGTRIVVEVPMDPIAAADGSSTVEESGA